MSIEEKAKAYDEALEAARKELGVDRKEQEVVQRVLHNIFPQLRESENERIRKWLYNYFSKIGGRNWIHPDITCEEVLAWLEKQEEIPMPNSTELIEMWDKEEAMLKEKDFRGDTWRIVYNAFMDGFARGTCVKFEKQKSISQENFDTAKHEALWGEQNRDFTIYHPLKNGNGKYECIPYSFYGSLSAFSEDKDLIDFLRTCFYTKEECEEWIKQKEQKPINSFDIVPYIDDKIAALQDMWREEKVSFDWDDLKDMIEDVARHFYHKEQKPSFGIYWHKIKKGEKLPCRAYVWNLDYEKHYDCFEGRLIANLENISVGSDTWYLPADDVRDLPREGVDELPEVQKPELYDMGRWDEESYNNGILHVLQNPEIYGLTKKPNIELIQQAWYMEGYNDREFGMEPMWIIKTGEGGPKHEKNPRYGQHLEPKPAEWSEKDEDRIRQIERIAQQAGCTQKLQVEIHDWLKSLRPQPKVKWSEEDKAIVNCIVCCLDGQFVPEAARKQSLVWFNKHRRDFLNSPSWKPSEEQLEALRLSFEEVFDDAGDCNRYRFLKSLYEQLKKL